jgi:hypothetical protein
MMSTLTNRLRNRSTENVAHMITRELSRGSSVGLAPRSHYSLRHHCHDAMNRNSATPRPDRAHQPDSSSHLHPADVTINITLFDASTAGHGSASEQTNSVFPAGRTNHRNDWRNLYPLTLPREMSHALHLFDRFPAISQDHIDERMTAGCMLTV